MKKFWIGVFNIILGLFVIAGSIGTVGAVASWGELGYPLEWFIALLGILVTLVGVASFLIDEKPVE